MTTRVILTTGVPGRWTEGVQPSPRLEIGDLIKNEKMFALYIQALQAMLKESQANPISHFQMGGIHGLPYTQWEGSGGQEAVPGSGWSGYCTHSSVLFPTWHRPYIALYEQVLYNHAQHIADTYTVDKVHWQTAAQNLRAPYWDWASNSVPPPEVISKETLTIITPNGQQATVPNPLWGYVFHPIDPSFPGRFSEWPKTLRRATSYEADATDDVDQLIGLLQREQSSLRQSTYGLLTRVDAWPAFSNSRKRRDGTESTSSIEGIHDVIHLNVGGSGHMADASVAGFDPIFYLHHANVDRLLALWQSIHSDVWVTPGSAEDGTWTIKAGSDVDATSGLTPFRETFETYWNSAAARSFTKLGYTYPEFVGMDLSDPNKVSADIADKVNQLYGGKGSGSMGALMRAAMAGSGSQQATQFVGAVARVKRAGDVESPASRGEVPRSIPIALSPPSGGVVPPSSSGHRAIEVDPQQPLHPTVGSSSRQPDVYDIHGSLIDWAVRVHMKKNEMGSSFSVLIFIGDVPEDPAEWTTIPSYVGSHAAFVKSVAERCENCRNQQDVVIEGFIHLDGAIATRSGLGSFDPSVVEPYLKRSLHWRVQKADGEVVPTANLESLEVTVISVPLKFSAGDMFPIPRGLPMHHPGITAGRQGGSRTS